MKVFLFLILLASSISASDEAKTAKESAEPSLPAAITVMPVSYASTPDIYITRKQPLPVGSKGTERVDFIVSKATGKPLEEMPIAVLRSLPLKYFNDPSKITIVLDKGTRKDLFNKPGIDVFTNTLTVRDLIASHGYTPSSGHIIWLIAHPRK